MVFLQLYDGKRLRNATTPLLHLSESAAIISTPTGISLQTSDTNDPPAVIAMLRIKDSSFCAYEGNWLDHQREICGTNLAALNDILATTRDSEYITAEPDCEAAEIDFLFIDNKDTSANRFVPAQITHLPENYVEIDNADYFYEVIVGIPSHCLRQIVIQNSYSGVVFVEITPAQVTLRTVIEKVVLKTENDECIIGGVQEGHHVGFHLNLRTISSSFLEASQFSERVWICKSSDAPLLLNCPVGSVGNIMFYFVNPLSF